MDANILKFTVGEKIPDWFNAEAAIGRARVNQDESGNLVNITLFTVSKQIIANIGDVIVKTNTGLTLIPQKKAIKYRVETEKPVKSKKSKRGGNKDE